MSTPEPTRLDLGLLSHTQAALLKDIAGHEPVVSGSRRFPLNQIRALERRNLVVEGEDGWRALEGAKRWIRTWDAKGPSVLVTLGLLKPGQTVFRVVLGQVDGAGDVQNEWTPERSIYRTERSAREGAITSAAHFMERRRYLGWRAFARVERLVWREVRAEWATMALAETPRDIGHAPRWYFSATDDKPGWGFTRDAYRRSLYPRPSIIDSAITRHALRGESRKVAEREAGERP